MGTHPARDAAMSAGAQAIPCPRCGATTVRQVAASPVPGRWVMMSCQTCWYAWRSSEPRTATDTADYPESFRLNPQEITAAPRMV
ncbi:MAG: vanillate/4-hydroxybenzoate decarboxylase subunit [Trebonia sp.]|nr:vanillate/4-hydroxybenzoate decarboxylase subunit [Trebonia sp.]